MPLVFEWEDDDWEVTGLYGHDVPDELWARYQTARDELDELVSEMMGCRFVDNRPKRAPGLLDTCGHGLMGGHVGCTMPGDLGRTGVADVGGILGGHHPKNPY
jgi:hypothetical protein